MRRVVITGLGIVSSLGNNKDEVKSSLYNASSGISFDQSQKEMGFRSQVSGQIDLNLEETIEINIKTISIPLIDIVGTRVSLGDYYFTNVNTGVGTSVMGLASGGYFYVDLYDIQGCDNLTTTTSTITAFVNY